MLLKNFLALLTAVALGVGVTASAGTITINESFDSDPGWTGNNNTSGGDNFTFSNTDELGLGAGVAGGEFDRGNDYATYMDTSRNFNFGPNDTIRGFVHFISTDIANHTPNDDMFIGHLADTQTIDNDPDFMVGAEIREGDPENRRFRFIAGTQAVGAGSFDGSNAAAKIGEVHTFSYEWRSDGTFVGTFNGAEVSNTNVPRPPDFSAIDGWGMASRERLGDAGGEGYNVFMDDVSYNAVPEPSTVALLAMCLLAIPACWRRR